MEYGNSANGQLEACRRYGWEVVGSNTKAISGKRLKAVVEAARRIWRKYTPYQLRQELLGLWEKMSLDTGVKFLPLCSLKKGEVLSCAVFGSGSFSTGRKELELAREIGAFLGWSPVQYTMVVTNRKRSNAKTVWEEFKDLGLRYVELDFADWYRENYDPDSKSPIRDTRFFYAPGSERPPREIVERNFNVRREFDRALNSAIMKSGDFPTSISLRGYNFPVFTTLMPPGQQVLVDDTHPADMSWVDPRTGGQLYPGWQSGATGKMRDDGHSLYRGSLIAVDLLDSFADAQKVDTGSLYTLSPGIRPPKVWSPRAIQGNMKLTEDYFFNALKATGLFPYLWGISEDPETVEYRRLDGGVIKLKQRCLIVGNRIRSGKDAFGQHLEDLNSILLGSDVKI